MPAPKNVAQLMSQIGDGEIVLPDFQRSFIWDPESVRELLVSIVGGYFIGSFLMMEEQSKEESPFAIRMIQGVREVDSDVRIQRQVRILLDGQQRATALWYALNEPGMALKDRKYPYRFFLSLEKALAEDWDKSIVAASTWNKWKLKEIEGNADFIPIRRFKDIAKLAVTWPREDPNFAYLVNLANGCMNHEIHIVELPRNTTLERIVETFERINRTGEPLSLFELATAKLYKDGVRLRDLWAHAVKAYEFASHVPRESILRVIALSRGKDPRRKQILELEARDFVSDWKSACRWLETAYRRTTDTKDGYGVLDVGKWMPYTTMFVPLAALIGHLKCQRQETKANYDKIDTWYWASVFTNAYDYATDTRAAEHFVTMKEWLDGSCTVPDLISSFTTKMVDLDIEGGPTHRGVMCLVVLEGALDFKTGQPPQFGMENIQDDHIFPRSVYRNDRIANRTLITTNASKGDNKPSEYFGQRQKEQGTGELTRILESHLIPPSALPALLNDDLDKFISERKKALQAKIREIVRTNV